MDVGTIATALLAVGVLALFMVLVRGIRNAEDDVAAVLQGILGNRVEFERPPATIEEPIRPCIDPPSPTNASTAADRSTRYDVAKTLASGTRP